MPPEGSVVRHTCDCRRCCNPSHLLLGTQADNVRDAVERRRFRLGEYNVTARLSDDECRAIAASPEPVRDLAQKHGVHYTTIWRLKRSKTWKTVAAGVNAPPRRRLLTLDDIRQLGAEPGKLRDVAAKYGWDQASVHKARRLYRSMVSPIHAEARQQDQAGG